MAYNVNIPSQGGQGPYGAVPGQIALPDPHADLANVYPNLSGATGQASSDILSELRGELSPETQKSIQDAAATFGVSSGMPLSGLSRNAGLRSLGLNTEQVQHQGLGDFLAGTKGVADTQTVTPELEAQIASRNAIFNSAPDPWAANSQAQALFRQQQDLSRYGDTTNAKIHGASVALGPSFGGQGAGRGVGPSVVPPAFATAPGYGGGGRAAVGPSGFSPAPWSPAPWSPAPWSPAPWSPPSGNLYGNTSPTDYGQQPDAGYDEGQDYSPYTQPSEFGSFTPGGGTGGGYGAGGDWGGSGDLYDLPQYDDWSGGGDAYEGDY